MRRRRKRAERRILAVLAATPSESQYARPMMRAARVSAGRLYPILARFIQHGLVTPRRENAPSSARMHRIRYRITERGLDEFAAREVGS